jgi:hypothetical protein
MVLSKELPALPPVAKESTGGADAGLQVGQVVMAVGERPLRLHADAMRSSLVLEAYPAGATFTVIEPSGDYAGYPVEQSGEHWYRLQAEDGLVGWAMVDTIIAR